LLSALTKLNEPALRSTGKRAQPEAA
jgi:hypothetical protein